MTAYCTVLDVEDETGLTFSTETHPTIAQVEEAIDGVGDEIDGVLQATGYALPVSNASALSLLKRYAKFGASAQAWHDAYVSDNDPARVVAWREDYKDFIARLRRGEQQLPGETSESGPQAGMSAGVKRTDGYSEGASYLISQGEFLRRRWRYR